MTLALLAAAAVLGLSLIPVVITSCFNALDRGAPVRLTAAGARWFLREWWAWLRTGLLHPTGWWRRQPSHRPPPWPAEPRPPVVLVPGFALNRASLRAWERHLLRCGWDWVHVVNNEPWEATVEAYARGLAKEVAAVKAASGADKVDLVGHSMGGVVCGLFVNTMDGAADVRRVVSVGTPWHGTRLHVFGRRKQVRDLQPDSACLTESCPPQVRFTSVWSTHDNLVWPARSSEVCGAESARLTHIGHLDLLYNPASIAAIAEALAAHSPRHALVAPTPEADAQPASPLPSPASA